MPVTLTSSEEVLGHPSPLKLSQFFAVSATADPAYLVVTAFDRDAYAAGASGAVGAFRGNGASLSLSQGIGNARDCGIVFTWQGGQYVNATYGALSGLTYTPPASAGDVTTLSVFTTASLSVADLGLTNPLALAQADPGGNVGSATIEMDSHPYVPAQGAAVTPAASS